MPAPVDDITTRRVVQEWLSGFPRDKIAIDNDIGEGTVSSIINYFKIGLDQSEFDLARELALEVMKQGLTLSELSSHIRLYNFIKTSGLAEDKIESFITNINSGDVSPEKTVEYINQLFAVSMEQSIPLDQVPSYIKEKLEEKKD